MPSVCFGKRNVRVRTEDHKSGPALVFVAVDKCPSAGRVNAQAKATTVGFRYLVAAGARLECLNAFVCEAHLSQEASAHR